MYHNFDEVFPLVHSEVLRFHKSETFDPIYKKK